MGVSKSLSNLRTETRFVKSDIFNESREYSLFKWAIIYLYDTFPIIKRFF